MKNIIVIILSVMMFSCNKQKTYDPISIDNQQDGMMMAPVKGGMYNLHDYQIEVYFDTIWIYDKDRYVGRFTYQRNSSLDSILWKDNE